MLESPRPLALLAEGCLTPHDAKTAIGLLRYRPERVAAVLDSTRAGLTAADCVGVGGGIPVVTDLEAASARGARALLIGIAPAGGVLPESWRAAVRGALTRGWDVISGLHQFLADDAEFQALSLRHGGSLIDVRHPPEGTPVAAGRAAALESLVVLTVGSDCNVGKMTAALEIARELSQSGERAEFVATGQTGIMISGGGVAIDAVTADFAAGVTERLVLDAAARADFVVVEGQGALRHPGFSGVSLALLHGAAPAALVLCHEAGREVMRSLPPGERREIPSLTRLRDEVECAAALVSEARVIGVALNTRSLEDTAARAACARAENQLHVPATDPVRFGAAPLAGAIRRAREARVAARDAREGGTAARPSGEPRSSVRGAPGALPSGREGSHAPPA